MTPRHDGGGSGKTLSYAVVSAVHDEERNLRRLHGCLFGQTVIPSRWVIVDTGSNDGTRAVASELAARFNNVEVVLLDLSLRSIRGGPVVQALHRGLSHIRDDVDVIAKVDADVTFNDDHFGCLLAEFRVDQRLGIASGSRAEWMRGAWRTDKGKDVEAQCRAYRRECLLEILPFEERLGWDSIDEIQARARGWKTRVVPDVGFRHHRALGSRDGSRWQAWYAQGEASHYLHYRPSYALLRSLYRARREPAALALGVGYMRAVVGGRPRQPSQEVRMQMRNRQRLRSLRNRSGERV